MLAGRFSISRIIFLSLPSKLILHKKASWLRVPKTGEFLDKPKVILLYSVAWIYVRDRKHRRILHSDPHIHTSEHLLTQNAWCEMAFSFLSVKCYLSFQYSYFSNMRNSSQKFYKVRQIAAYFILVVSKTWLGNG